MPSASTTIRLAILCAVGVVALYALDVAARVRRQASTVADLPSWSIDAATIEVAFSSNGLPRTFQFSDGSWSISSPVSAPADDTQVQSLLDALSQSPRIRRIPSRESSLRGLTPADFGLDPPQATLTIRNRHGASHTIAFGAPPPAATNELFAAIAGEEAVTVIDNRAFSLLSRPLVDFSDRRLCRSNLREVTRISIERPGQEPFRLLRSADRESWRISSPVSIAADWGEMQKFFETLAQARIASFLLGADAFAEENASLVIRLFSDKTPFPVVVALGVESRDGTFSALAEGGSPVTIPAETARSLAITPNTIRDRRVFASGHTLDVTALTVSLPDAGAPLVLTRTDAGDWEATSPACAPADQDAVSRLLAEILSLKATGFAQAPTNDAALASAISVTIATPSATNRLDCSFDESNATIVLDGAPAAALAPAASLSTLLALAGDPTLAFSRSLGAFPLREILSIDIARDDGSSQRFDFAPDGSMSIGGDDATTEPIADAAEISTRLAAMSRFLAAIEASAVVLPAASDVVQDHPAGAAHQAASPRISVTIEPRDPQKTTLTLRFGSPDPDAGTVLVSTSDAPDAPLFALPASIFEIFARNFRESYHAAEQ